MVRFVVFRLRVEEEERRALPRGEAHVLLRAQVLLRDGAPERPGAELLVAGRRQRGANRRDGVVPDAYAARHLITDPIRKPYKRLRVQQNPIS